MLLANGGDSTPAHADQMRVRISNDATCVVLYDNQAASSLDAAPSTNIGGGQITVHK